MINYRAQTFKDTMNDNKYKIKNKTGILFKINKNVFSSFSMIPTD